MSEQSPIFKGKWHEYLEPELALDYMRALSDFLKQEKNRGYVIYPTVKNWFKAFDCTPFEQVKVVMLGQDPYHGAGQAHGMCFSVSPTVPPPPSLVNIIKELKQDLGYTIDAKKGYLEPWARQGVLLLNSVLTVRASQPGSHAGKGWEQFTDKAIKTLNEHASSVVFMLWGRYARQKAMLIDTNKHLVLEAAHPSPMSVRGFLGCRHFSKANAWLEEKGIAPVDWRL